MKCEWKFVLSHIQLSPKKQINLIFAANLRNVGAYSKTFTTDL